MANIVSDIPNDHNSSHFDHKRHVATPIVRYASEDDPYFRPAVYPEHRVETDEEIRAWQARSLTDLENWLVNASDRPKALGTWQAVYIRCGACLRSWEVWVAANPIVDDLLGWIAAAREVITKNRWV